MEYYEDYCDVWPDTHQNLEDESQESPSSAMFSLVFHVSFIHLSEEDIDLDIDGLIETFEDYQTFEVERNRLLDNNISQQTLEGILSSMDVPCRSFFVEKILNCAREMERERVYENQRVLRMHVKISVVLDDDEEAEELSTLYAEADEAETSMVGASKSAMENLEMFEIENENLEMFEIENENSPCSICLEEFCLGSHVLRLPCSHVFHRHCIVNWFNRSKFCPLCRFEMKESFL